MTTGPYISTRRAAEELGVKDWVIRRWVKRGKLTGFKVGEKLWRIPASEVERLKKEKEERE